MGRLRRFVELRKEVERLEEALGPKKKELERLQAKLQDDFAKSGMQRITVDGFTVYLHRQIWATYPMGRPAAVAALKEAGFDEFVKEDFNHQSVSSMVRRLVSGEDDADPADSEDGTDGRTRLPREFVGAIDFTEQFSVRAQRA